MSVVRQPITLPVKSSQKAQVVVCSKTSTLKQFKLSFDLRLYHE